MQDQLKNGCVDFGNFQLSYTFTASSSFTNLRDIDEKYVASLRFTAPGVSVGVVATATQLEVWRDYFELSVTDHGVYMKTLPIMRPRKEDAHFYVTAYSNKLSFTSGEMDIFINLADCLKEFASYVDEIYCKLEEKERESWWP